MKKINFKIDKDIIPQMGYGYLRMAKGLLFCLAFMAGFAALSLIIVFPLRTLAVQYRLIYNIITAVFLSVFIGVIAVRRITKSGAVKTLLFLGFLTAFVAMILLNESLFILGLSLSLGYLAALFVIKTKKLLNRGICYFFVFLGYVNGFYWITILFSRGFYFIALPVIGIYLFFLGILLYEKKLHNSGKVFM